jgi:hypothetical protein
VEVLKNINLDHVLLICHGLKTFGLSAELILRGVVPNPKNRLDFAILLGQESNREYTLFPSEIARSSMFSEIKFFPLFGREEGTFNFERHGCKIKVYNTHRHYLKRDTQLNWDKIAEPESSVTLLRRKLGSLNKLFQRMKEQIDHPTTIRVEVSVPDVITAQPLL